VKFKKFRFAGVAAVLVVATVGMSFRVAANRSAPRSPQKAHAAIDAERAAVTIDGRRQQLIGVRMATAERGLLTESVRAAGVVTYDETRLTDINLKVEGWIRDLYVNYTGQPVRQNQALFSVFSPDLISAETQLVAAVRSRAQIAPAGADARDYAIRFLDTPRQRLQRWDVPDDQVRAIEASQEIPPTVVFRSPVSGVVIEKTAIKGMHAAPGQRLYKLADISTVWIEAEFHEPDVSRLIVGADAEIRLDAWPGERFSGRVTSINPFLNEATRTLTARLELRNGDGRAKPGMFANVEVSGPSIAGLLVPVDAVMDSGQRQLVFVSDGAGHFEPRPVTVGASAAGRTLIVSGLKEHEEVAARAAFLIDSESQLRAALESYGGSRPPTGEVREPVRLDVRVAPGQVGDNEVKVTARTADGRPVTNAQVAAVFSMPAMPSMNMPPMHSDAVLNHVGDGVYAGTGSIAMSGRWEVTVSATRHGEPMGTARTTLVAR
jgi:multidrug efflux pump subunit AcrA (membrane-fusion protein)